VSFTVTFVDSAGREVDSWSEAEAVPRDGDLIQLGDSVWAVSRVVWRHTAGHTSVRIKLAPALALGF
jgi:glyoxylase-like metal-dependent hydrolase (beta-lactamase superfamily II)